MSRLLVALLPKHVNGDSAHKPEIVRRPDLINNSSYTQQRITLIQFRNFIRNYGS